MFDKSKNAKTNFIKSEWVNTGCRILFQHLLAFFHIYFPFYIDLKHLLELKWIKTIKIIKIIKRQKEMEQNHLDARSEGTSSSGSFCIWTREGVDSASSEDAFAAINSQNIWNIRIWIFQICIFQRITSKRSGTRIRSASFRG